MLSTTLQLVSGRVLNISLLTSGSVLSTRFTSLLSGRDPRAHPAQSLAKSVLQHFSLVGCLPKKGSVQAIPLMKVHDAC